MKLTILTIFLKSTVSAFTLLGSHHHRPSSGCFCDILRSLLVPSSPAILAALPPRGRGWGQRRLEQALLFRGEIKMIHPLGLLSASKAHSRSAGNGL